MHCGANIAMGRRSLASQTCRRPRTLYLPFMRMS